MKNILLLLLIITGTTITAQESRFDKIKSTQVKENKKHKVFVSFTEDSRDRAKALVISELTANPTFTVIQSIDLADYVLDFEVNNSIPGESRCRVTIYNSKGKLLGVTKKGRGSSNAWNGNNSLQLSIRRCIEAKLVPKLKELNRKPLDEIIVVKNQYEYYKVLIVTDPKDVEELVKGKEIKAVTKIAKAKFSLTTEDVIKELQEKAKIKLQKQAGLIKSPVILITDEHGLEGKEKVGYTGITYKYKKIK